jgi:hypothetical protein
VFRTPVLSGHFSIALTAMAGHNETTLIGNDYRRTPALVPNDLGQERDLLVAVLVRVSGVGDQISRSTSASNEQWTAIPLAIWFTSCPSGNIERGLRETESSCARPRRAFMTGGSVGVEGATLAHVSSTQC